jgi:hypothetical protein
MSRGDRKNDLQDPGIFRLRQLECPQLAQKRGRALGMVDLKNPRNRLRLRGFLVDRPIMAKMMRNLRFTIGASGIALALILTACLTNVDLVKVNLSLLDGIENREVDDILSGVALIMAGIALDGWYRRKRHKAEVEAQKLRTLRATMRTVQDIVNNFLNNLMVFEMAASSEMPDGSRDRLEDLIQETSQKLKALGDLQSVQERVLAIGIGIAFVEPVTIR